MLLECERGRFRRAVRELFMSDEQSANYHKPEAWHARFIKEGDEAGERIKEWYDEAVRNGQIKPHNQVLEE